MTRKMRWIVFLGLFMLPPLFGVGLNEYHKHFHTHQAETKKLLEQSCGQVTTLHDQERSVTLTMPTTDCQSSDFALYYDVVRHADLCWMQRMSEFILDSMPALSLFLWILVIVIFPVTESELQEVET